MAGNFDWIQRRSDHYASFQMHEMSGMLVIYFPRRRLTGNLHNFLQLPNVNPETGERDNAVPYKVLMKFRTGIDPTHKMKPCVGCNGVPASDGLVKVGDLVYVKKMI